MAKTFIITTEQDRLINLDDIVSIRHYPTGDAHGKVQITWINGFSMEMDVTSSDYTNFISLFELFHVIS